MHRICTDIISVSVDDDNLDLFENQYPLTYGISYNSYLIEDKKIAVIDSVDIRRCDEWIAELDRALDGRQPAYLIVQHVEPDHSGSIATVLDRYPEMTMVCSAKAAEMLESFFPEYPIRERVFTVREGDKLDLGVNVLEFYMAPMVHWPEVMVTYDRTRETLFSADAFGTFAPAAGSGDWASEARRYYCNIVGKYGPGVQALLRKLSKIEIKTICPLHGPVLTENIAAYVALYDKWSRYEPETRGVLVAYASIYGGTAQAAHTLAHYLEEEGAGEVVLVDLARCDVSYAVAEAFRLSAMVLCSVSYDGDLFPPMHNFIHHLKLKNFGNRKVGLIENGSWAPIAARLMRDELASMKNMAVIEPVVTIRSRLRHENDETLHRLARNMMTGSAD